MILKRIFFLILLVIIASTNASPQSDKEKVGSEQRNYLNGGLFDFSDKNKVNIEVNVWGYAKNSGKYIIPKGSSFQDLLSYSGGPLQEANLDDIRLLRQKNDSLGIKENQVFNLNYDDFLWKDSINTKKIVNPVLQPGDLIIFTGGPRYFFRDNLTLITSLTSLVLTIAIFIVTLTK
jgi:hypothetical protein